MAIEEDDEGQDFEGEPDPIEMPIEPELDLHTFHPREVGSVVEEYLHAAREKGFSEVRIVHGKGIGNLRRTVHAVLEKHPAVASFRLAGGDRGAWGATLVVLRPATEV